ncbi:unnamed protein product [Paramecium octaurelia]|uniref:Fatty acid desaturase domain-containing protein n=1 Tax=Paramecium octaurelia TaxID=43137 RepID=A0A8S1YIH0_PAROT|nr:unnamed protein product [Paramecium octaurelia]
MLNSKIKIFNDDSLLFSSYQYYTVPFLYTMAIILISYFENAWIAIWIVYTLIPFLDEFFSLDLRNPSKDEQNKLEQEMRFKLPLYVCVIFDWISLIWMINFLLNNEIQIFNKLGIIFLCGNLAASNINIAHELFHKDNLLDKLLGTVTLARNLYIHFAIEHIHGHHRNVATPKDPATSLKGQKIWNFLPQTIIGSYVSAWNFEADLMLKKYGSVIRVQNRMIWYTISYFIIPCIIYYYFGFFGCVYFLGTVINSVVYLETINYVEHYGLSRKEIQPGKYEQVDIRHSWNAPHRLSNYLLFKLQRHSDHHENPYKSYQTLCSYEESPQLPHGYTVCILLAWVPNLWFEIMDLQLKNWEHHKKNVTSDQVHHKMLNFIFKIGLVTTTLATASIAL